MATGLGPAVLAPWTPRRRPEWTREIALGTAGASLWSIGTSPALNQWESGGKGCGFPAKAPISKFAKSRANFLISFSGSSPSISESTFCLINCDSFPFPVEISADLGGNRGKSRFGGGSGPGDRGQSARRLPGPCPNLFF
ncbi:hypothetical protein CRG98_003948 [Punica granatum]|uniref:Uncharacterized protein n=1 Tax=Punica granatum TaxID=22663 RepID=A0A2I0L4S1_PUNGR|nr:hypothetical protein CRG98_003948 [Punica granatum]